MSRRYNYHYKFIQDTCTGTKEKSALNAKLSFRQLTNTLNSKVETALDILAKVKQNKTKQKPYYEIKITS